MFFSQTVEYALRAAVWLADHPDSPQTTRQIAEATQVPESYLSKVLQAMSRADLVSGQRGLGGGYSLTRSATDISVLDVIESVEPFQRIRSCPLDIEAHGTRLCPLHRKLDDALASVAQSLADSSLADMLVPGQKLHPLCSPEQVAQRANR